MPRQPRKVRTPGSPAETTPAAPAGDTAPDQDAAIAAGAAGGTHKVSKHPDPKTLPKSKIVGDPARRPDMPVNAKGEMKYEDALKLMNEGKLTRSVLTDQGWLVVPRAVPGKK